MNWLVKLNSKMGRARRFISQLIIAASLGAGAVYAVTTPGAIPKMGKALFAMVPKVGCSIKGNVSIGSGERIYHVPGQLYYEETVIRTEYGEQWFCSEAEARAAGWRKSGV